MSNGPWTDEENDLIVADYFAMLADVISARRYSKAEHRRALLPLLNDRSEGSVEFKHQNISAVLKGLGEDWIPGYKPAFSFQMTLVDAVARWLALNPAWLGRQSGLQPAAGLREAAQLWIWSETTRVDFRVAELAEPRPGDRIEINGDAFLIQGEPVRDSERLVWTVDLRPA